MQVHPETNERNGANLCLLQRSRYLQFEKRRDWGKVQDFPGNWALESPDNLRLVDI